MVNLSIGGGVLWLFNLVLVMTSLVTVSTLEVDMIRGSCLWEGRLEDKQGCRAAGTANSAKGTRTILHPICLGVHVPARERFL